MLKLDILVIAAHPDDAELGCGGTIASHVRQGKKVGIVDLTRGELGTRGTPEIRAREAEAAQKVLGLSVRENLGFSDAFFANDRAHQLALIQVIRKYQPDIILANAVEDRHPDHGRAAALVKESCFYAGLRKIETIYQDKPQQPWRPAQLYHFIQSNYINPDLIVDVSDSWEKKMEAIRCFESQFDGNNNPEEPQTFLTTPIFLQFVEARARELGHSIGVTYGEGFTIDKPIGLQSFYDIH